MRRRTFLRQSSLAAAGAALAAPLAAGETSERVSPNEKIRLGIIGANNMGWSNMIAFFKIPGVTCAAIADVDQAVLDRRAAEAEKQQGFRPKLFKDYRKLLDMKDLDAVVVGTPDHWHCIQLCDALAAGKHVYCEKPVGRTIEECQVMRAVAGRYPKQLVQVGQWQRSGTHYATALDFVRSGRLGNIRLVKVWSYVGWKKPVPVRPDAPAPEGVDYPMWLGPAPARPFNPNRFHGDFRWFWDYAGGLMTDWGVHQFDIALVGMGLKTPKSVMASGGKFGFPDADGETPDTLQAVYEYDNCNVLWEHAFGLDGGPYGRTEGIAFIGNNGTLVVNRGNWSLLPEAETGADGLSRYKVEKMPDQHKPYNVDYLELHARNFLDCIRDNTPEKLNCGIETAANVAINCCLGNIAYRLQRKVFWDAATGRFRDDRDADRLVQANYQNGWKLPG